MQETLKSDADFSAFDNRTADLKRKADSGDIIAQKQHKFNNVIEAMRSLECSDESKEKLKRLIVSGEADINETDDHGCTPLFYAIYKNYFGWIPTLLECEADPSRSNGPQGNATDVAWNNSKFDVLLCLLMADGPVPKDFDANQLGFLHRFSIEEILKERTLFHQNVAGNNFGEVVTFIQKNSKVKYVYDSNNSCALSTALKMKNFAMYAHLRSEGFAQGVDEEHDYLMKRLSMEDKKYLESEIQKFFGTTNAYIFELVAKSRLGMNNDRENFSKILKLFENLDKISEIQPVLKLLANHENLSIVFDFNSSSICGVDVTNCFNENVKGRAYPSGQIMIGAMRQKNVTNQAIYCDPEVLGTLAHEMTHLAMHLVYSNKCCPYSAEDDARRQEYAEVITETESLCNTALQHNDIQNAFRGKPASIQAEVIVRAPHLMALHSAEPQELEKIQEVFHKLFDFYNFNFIPDAENELSRIESRKKNQELNRQLGTFASLRSSNIRCEKAEEKLSETFRESGNTFISTRVPPFVMSSLLTAAYMKAAESMCIVIKSMTMNIVQPSAASYHQIISR